MRLMLIVLMLALAFLSCNSKSSDDGSTPSERESPFTPLPEAGTYTYKPWILFKAKSKNLVLSDLMVKVPGATDFATASTILCDTNVLPNMVSPDRCIEVTQSGTLSYYINSATMPSEPWTAAYTINLATNNLNIAARAEANATPESIVLEEKQTVCQYWSSTSLVVVIQTVNTAKLDSRSAYFIFKINSPVKPGSSTFTPENETEVGLKILPASDPFPQGGLYGGTYSTLSLSTTPGVGTPSCTITVSAAEPGRVISGNLSCANLPVSPLLGAAPLGKVVDISGSWQCDSYKTGF